jgi:hypothetical protein
MNDFHLLPPDCNWLCIVDQCGPASIYHHSAFGGRQMFLAKKIVANHLSFQAIPSHPDRPPHAIAELVAAPLAYPEKAAGALVSCAQFFDADFH